MLSKITGEMDLNLKICNIFFIFASACTINADNGALFLRKFREPGDQLDISIQQELERAVYLGCQWLEQQLTAQSFDQNSPDPTGVALTLSALYSHTEKESTAPALQWLQDNYQSQSATNVFVAAWGLVALSLHHAENIDDATAIANLKRHLNQLDTNEDAKALCRELLNTFNTGVNDYSPPTPLTQLARNNVDQLSLLQMWLVARHINREGGILSVENNRRIDWKTSFARRIISTQKISPKGGGFWEFEPRGTAICNTALAILICKEF